MAALNYNRRLEKLQLRRYDTSLNESTLTRSFSLSGLPEDLRYLAESMQPLEIKFNQRTKQAAQNVENHLEKRLKLSFTRAYKNQGSVMTDTNIKASDIDLLSLINSYHFLPANQKPTNPYEGEPSDDILEFRKQTVKLLKEQYDEVDDTGAKAVTIYNKNLKRKVDVVLCYWYDSEKYQKLNDEYYRGIYIYNFEKGLKQLDFPFAHIANVQYKGNVTNDGSRRAIRLLKSLKEDAEKNIDLSSFQLTSIVHNMSDANLYFNHGDELKITENTSIQIKLLIENSSLRKSLLSPNGTEKPLEEDKVVVHLKSIKEDLDQLILDCKNDLRNTSFEKSLKNYM